MSVKVGKDCKILIGAYKILGMGNWSLSGATAEQIESTVYGDNWRTYEFGVKDGGTISFGGFLDPADSTGQEALRYAHNENTDLTGLMLFVDSSSSYQPNLTVGYFSPATTTGADTPVSHVNLISVDINSDRGGLVSITFQAKVSGVMVLV